MKELPFKDNLLIKEVIKGVNRCITHRAESFTVGYPLSRDERREVITRLRKQDASMGNYFVGFLWRAFTGRVRNGGGCLSSA